MKQSLNFGVEIEIANKDVDLPKDKSGLIIRNNLAEREVWL